MAKNRDSISDRTGAQPFPETPALKMTLEEALIALAQSQAQTNLALAQITGDRESFLRQEREDTERFKRLRAECEKTATQRTQEAADRRWPAGEGRFRCVLMQQKPVADPADPARRRKVHLPDILAFPEVEINASSADEARERYRVVCFISGTECEVRALVVGLSPVVPAQRDGTETGYTPGMQALTEQGVTEV